MYTSDINTITVNWLVHTRYIRSNKRQHDTIITEIVEIKSLEKTEHLENSLNQARSISPRRNKGTEESRRPMKFFF